MGLQKKHIIVGGIALVSLTAAYLYWQFIKLKNSAIKFSGVKFKQFTATKLDFDLILTFNNASKIKLDIVSQDYKVYINNTLITTANNLTNQPIQAFSISPITISVSVNWPSVLDTLKSSIKDILLNPVVVGLRVEVNVKVKVYGITLNIPYSYITNLKDLTTKKPAQ